MVSRIVSLKLIICGLLMRQEIWHIIKFEGFEICYCGCWSVRFAVFCDVVDTNIC